MSRVEGGKDERKKADAGRQRESVRTCEASSEGGLSKGPGRGAPRRLGVLGAGGAVEGALRRRPCRPCRPPLHTLHGGGRRPRRRSPDTLLPAPAPGPAVVVLAAAPAFLPDQGICEGGAEALRPRSRTSPAPGARPPRRVPAAAVCASRGRRGARGTPLT